MHLPEEVSLLLSTTLGGSFAAGATPRCLPAPVLFDCLAAVFGLLAVLLTARNAALMRLVLSPPAHWLSTLLKPLSPASERYKGFKGARVSVAGKCAG